MMPKLPSNQKDIRLVGVIETYQKLYRTSDEELALAMGCCLRTLQHRKRRACDFTLSELRAVAKKCNIPMEELTKHI